MLEKASPKTNRKPKEEKEEEEEPQENEETESGVVQRISSRTKKIKKLGDEFELDDPNKRRSSQVPTKKAAPKPKENKKEAVMDNWVQCDSCNQWRILKSLEEGKYRIIMN